MRKVIKRGEMKKKGLEIEREMKIEGGRKGTERRRR